MSRTLEASDEDTLAAGVEVLWVISRSFIEAAVLEILKRTGVLDAGWGLYASLDRLAGVSLASLLRLK